MRILEIIEIRSHAAGREQLRRELIQFAKEINGAAGDESVRVYARTRVQSDFSVHIERTAGRTADEGSQSGLQLMLALREYGLVNRSVWFEDV